jgi:large subunit ribosomal protein L9
MDVILLERIERLGQMGDVVKVKGGYARNYLLPKGKALRATTNNLERFQTERVELEARNLERRQEAEAVAAKMDGAKVVLVRQASDMGQLYGSVTVRDVTEMLAEAGFQIGRGQVVLDRPIKTLGIHPVRVSLHPEVYVTVECNVARSLAEAEQQAAGIFFDSPELAAEAEEELEEAFEEQADGGEDQGETAAEAEPER